MTQWQSFLTQQGAQWNGDTLATFDSESIEADSTKTPLINHRLLIVEGPDAQSFLQGQLTCDTRKLEQNQLLLGAHCNAQGRMISSFWAFQVSPQRFALRIAKDNLERAQAALQKYIVFSKAQLSISEWEGILFTGSELPAGAAGEPGHVIEAPDLVYLHHQDGAVEAWGQVEKVTELWLQCQKSTPVLPQALNYWQIQRGIPEVLSATSEQFIPQQFNFHLCDGVSFNKGCYTGQEIVARVHYKGKVKKYALPLKFEPSHDSAEVGGLLKDQKNEKDIGPIIYQARLDPTRHLAMVCGSLGELERDGKGHLGNLAVNFSWLTLPYAIPNE